MRTLSSLRSSICLVLMLVVSTFATTLRNERLVLTIDDANGHLVELRRTDGPNLLATRADNALWRITVRHPDGTQSVLDPSHAKACSVKAMRSGVEMRWEGVQAKERTGRLNVVATVKATPSGRSEWSIDVKGEVAGGLWSVQYPRVCGLRSLGTSRLAVPLYLGRVVTNPAANGYSLTLAYPQPASMQCFAFWTHEGGDGEAASEAGAETGWSPDESGAEALYLAAEDGEGYFKRFTVKADREAKLLDWWVEHIPGLDTWPLPKDDALRAVHYETPYPIVLTPYMGDMQEAAKLYQNWAKGQVWCQRGKQENWPDTVKPGSKDEALWTPPWFRQLACWLKYYHEPAKILPEFAAYQKWLNVPMASHWYRYNISKFDDNYNEMLPGDPYLLQGIQDAKALGVQPLPYINGVIWDTDTESWQRENGLAAAIKNEAGEFIPWDIHGEIFAYMCPVEQWRAKMREVVRKLVGEHGMSGVYLDCLAATGIRPCYDPSHGHTIRGGSYRTTGNRQLMHDLRADARSYAPEACFFTEEIGEIFVDCMDGFLTLDYLRSYCRPGERVFPFFSLVYHPYTINFGSDAAIGQDPDAFRLQMGSMYMWGAQPLLSSQVAQPPREGDPDSEFLRNLVRHFNDVAKPYLTGGEWVPISIRAPGSPASKRAIDLVVNEHKVEYSKLRNRKRVWTGPAVLASAWKRGDSLAVTMVNITDQDQRVTLSVANGFAHPPADTAGLHLRNDSGTTRGMMAMQPPTAIQKSETQTAMVVTFSIPAGSVRTYAPSAGGNTPLTFQSQGEFVQADAQGGFGFRTCRPLVSADGATLVSTRVADQCSVHAVRRRADGTVASLTGKAAEKTGPKAEGHGLPRSEMDRPFLVAKSPHTFPFYSTHPQASVHDADDGFLLASMSGREAMQLYSTTATKQDPAAFALPAGVLVATDIKRGTVAKPLDGTWKPPVSPETELLCASVEHMHPSMRTSDERLQRIMLGTPTLRLPSPLRRAATRLLEAPSDKALSAASKALYEACLEARQDPKRFVADRPLAQAMERLHALLCARTAMLPLVEIEDDWLSPGFDKGIRVTPAPGYPDRKPDSIEVVPVGDWAEGAVTVTEKVLKADKATNTHTFALTLNDGLYVERMVPVLFFLKVTRDGHEFIIPEVVRLEANRPVHLIKPRGTTQAVVGRESQATFTLRNWSPHAVTARLRTSAEGFGIKLATETVECPPLSDTPINLRFAAEPNTRPGTYRLPLLVFWSHLPKGTVMGYATVDLREALVPVTQNTDWSPVAEDNRTTFRREGQVAIWAEAGEEIRATIHNVRVTRYVDSCVARLLDMDGKEVWKKTIPVDQQAELTWKVQTTGAHILHVNPKMGSAVVEIRNRAVGEIASKRATLNLFCSPIKRVFYVPTDAKEFRFGSNDGGVDETAAVRLVSPTGRVVIDRKINEASPALPTAIEVKPDEAGKLWQLEITPRQDISLWLEGDVCSVLSPAPARALRGRQ